MKATKTVYWILTTSKEGKIFGQYLMLSELHLIAQITKENASVDIRRTDISIALYKSHFGN